MNIGVETILREAKARAVPMVTRRVRDAAGDARREGGPFGGVVDGSDQKETGHATEATRPVVAVRSTLRCAAPGFRA